MAHVARGALAFPVVVRNSPRAQVDSRLVATVIRTALAKAKVFDFPWNQTGDCVVLLLQRCAAIAFGDGWLGATWLRICSGSLG